MSKDNRNLLVALAGVNRLRARARVLARTAAVTAAALACAAALSACRNDSQYNPVGATGSFRSAVGATKGFITEGVVDNNGVEEDILGDPSLMICP